MEHLQNRKLFVEQEDRTERNSAESERTSKRYEEEQILFLSKSCSALIDEDDKYMVLTAMMAVFNVDWYSFRDWYTERYIGK